MPLGELFHYSGEKLQIPLPLYFSGYNLTYSIESVNPNPKPDYENITICDNVDINSKTERRIENMSNLADKIAIKATEIGGFSITILNGVMGETLCWKWLSKLNN